MTGRPTSELNWGGTAVEPSGGQKSSGYAASDRPPAQWFNWHLQTTDVWLKFLNACFGDAVAQQGFTFDGNSSQFARLHRRSTR